MNSGTLYIVATPIGNLEDITLRAIAVLTSVDLILCEDTRVTMKLLQRYNIDTPLLSYHTHSSLKRLDGIIKMISEGKKVALVSDAGTPGISDPGSVLVAKVREKLPGIKIAAIPGANAAVAALSISGLPSSDFLFLGFLPHKKGRQTLFREIAASKRTVVFYESPHRIIKTFESLSESLSPNRRVAIGRELTKRFEEMITGSASEILVTIRADKNKQKGEFVVIVNPE